VTLMADVPFRADIGCDNIPACWRSATLICAACLPSANRALCLIKSTMRDGVIDDFRRFNSKFR